MFNAEVVDAGDTRAGLAFLDPTGAAAEDYDDETSIAQLATNALGQYTVANLPAGPTWLEFVDPAGTHAIRWYHNDNGSNPTSIPVVAGQAVTGVDETPPAFP